MVRWCVNRVLGALLLVAGCGRIGFEPAPSPADGAPTVDATRRDATASDATAANCTAVISCPQNTISTNTSDSSSYGVTANLDRGLAGSCGGSAGAEATFEVTAQVPGHYTFSVPQAGSKVLYVRDVCCTGPELACSSSPSSSSIQLALTGNQVVVVIIDGAALNELATLNLDGAP
ncbi:hypothetical protein BH11MYX1_BH11MYX1_24020 [soil metagenome]